MASIIKFSIGLLFLTLMSCDPGIQYDKIIRNETGYEVQVCIKYIDGTSDSTDTLLLPSNQEVIVYNYNHIGKVNSYKNCDGHSTIDSLSINLTNNDPLSVNINPNLPENWNFNVIDQRISGGGICECRLSIINDDIIQEQ